MAKEQFYDCFEQFQYVTEEGGIASDFEGMWYACIPHSEPKIIEGSWATDFEWNAFFEGRRVTPKGAFPEDFLPPNLAFKEGVEMPPQSSMHARLWALKFVGREEICNLDDAPPTFFVEEILEQELVWEVPGHNTMAADQSVP